MTDAAQIQTPDQSQTPAQTGTSSDAATAPFYETWSDRAIATDPSIQLFKSPEDLGKAYVNLFKRMGAPPERLLTLPADPADAEGMRGIYAKLGLPDKPEGYGLQAAENATDADKAAMKGFAEEMHKAGAPAQFVKPAVEYFNQLAAKAQEQRAATFEQAKTTAETELKKDWGAAYEQRMQSVGKFLTEVGGPDLAAELNSTLLASSPKLIRAISQVVERTVEAGAPPGNPSDAAQANKPMTPTQAQGAYNALVADPIKGKALLDANHAMHKSVVAERSRLLALMDGRQPA